MKDYDCIVLGAGHAGCEAALAVSRMGMSTLCLTLNLDSVGLMPCNPAIGGTSKGHLVREIDALGGEMGQAADDCLIQIRMLNTGKGAAVQSLRAQTDKRRYHERMKLALESSERLTLIQGECTKINTRNGKITGITTDDGMHYSCRAVIVACGVYLRSRILVGDKATISGPAGLLGANSLSRALTDKGFLLRRFKTGTPPRIHRASVDFSRLTPQYGDVPLPKFSFLTSDAAQNKKKQVPCYLAYTNSDTHRIILDNIHRSAMFSGLVTGTGTRYCPSIEDKLVKFPDKDRHQIFIEPEGLTTNELYVQGMSTSLPRDVQTLMLRSMDGLEKVQIMRYGYAIEYDCIDPTQLNPYLCAKEIEGLYFAGQINGSSGYEEAAAQGLYAGINAGLYLKNEEPLYISRSDGYIGVLCDDLATKGTNEPYRMMTSRAEYRLILRQDNADLRLTELGRRTGLISKKRYDLLMKKKDATERAMRALTQHVAPSEPLAKLLDEINSPAPKSGISLADLLKREGMSYTALLQIYPSILPKINDEARTQVEIMTRYAGYIDKQRAQIAEQKKLEDMSIPEGIDYGALGGLRIEAVQKLTAIRPTSIGQAGRISGVSPADITVLIIKLREREQGR